MNIEEVADIINKIALGIEETCMKCLADNSETVVHAVTEQLYSGLDGDSDYLEPTYDNDPYFDDPDSRWYQRAKEYKQWKYNITPPEISPMLGFSPRPEEVPNLFIDGTFYSTISAFRRGDELVVESIRGDGPEIVAKYGDQILEMSDRAVKYFNVELLLPAIEQFFKECGYQ